jgi:sialic acid synthase SpsE
LVTKDNVRSVRPGTGMHTRYLGDVLGSRFACDVEKGTPLGWSLLERSDRT